MERLLDALNSFRCYKDPDIEQFLHTKAIEFLRRRWCSVYLIMDEAAFDAGKLDIQAYFTLSHKTLIPDHASNTAIRNAGGFSGAGSLHFVLIGQLGKYLSLAPDGRMIASAITGKEIISKALEIIRAADELIPCRCVLVECGDDSRVQDVYRSAHFKFFQHDGAHNQFYRRIDPFPDELDSSVP